MKKYLKQNTKLFFPKSVAENVICIIVLGLVSKNYIMIIGCGITI